MSWWLLPWLDSLFRDAWFAVRILRKNLVVTAAVVASLSLAIGACLGAFSLVDALILRPLPVRALVRTIVRDAALMTGIGIVRFDSRCRPVGIGEDTAV